MAWEGKNPVKYWQVNQTAVWRALDSDPEGLKDSEVRRRRKLTGINNIFVANHRPWWRIYWQQFNNPFVLILVAATVLSWWLGDRIEAIIILAIVIVNAWLAGWQDYKAEVSLRELQKYLTHYVQVRRGGKIERIDARQLVSGDVVELSTGDVVGADIRLMSVEGLSVNEAILTGESLPVDKNNRPSRSRKYFPQNIKNMVFAGTSIASGSAWGVVTDTGNRTWLGQTAADIYQQNAQTEFQRGLKNFSWVLVRIVTIMTVAIFGLNVILGKGILEAFLFALALAVGMTPEVLPMIVTLSLASAAHRLLKRKVICKTLPAIENLGKIEILCTDKTGTLTEGKLKVMGTTGLAQPDEKNIFLYSLLCSHQPARLKNTNSIDAALWQDENLKILAKKALQTNILSINDFDFERRRMSVLAEVDGRKVFICKGAGESILSVCRWAQKGKRKILITPKIKRQLVAIEGAGEDDGYRLIAVATASTRRQKMTIRDEKNLTFLGWVKYFDAPKKTVRPSFKKLHDLNVDIKIISGDSELVNRRICREVGFEISQNRVINGTKLSHLNEKEWAKYALKYNVFVRVNPHQKHKLISVLREQGQVVGYLGDGVNDAPALAAADVGISVDDGVEVAKEAADIILMQKSMTTLAEGVREGRKTYGNIMKYILNTISANYGNMLTVVIASIFLPFIPMLPGQILALNFLTDGQHLAIADDAVDEEWLARPRQWNMAMVTEFMVKFGIISSIFDLIFITILYFYLHAHVANFQTSWFLFSVITEIIITFAIRTKRAFWRSPTNIWLIALSLIGVAGAIVLIYTQWGRFWLEFTAIPADVLILVLVVAGLYFGLIEWLKKGFFAKYNI